MDLLTIGSGDRTIVAMARVHPGETPASFIMEGFIDFISNPTCELARVIKMTIPGWEYSGIRISQQVHSSSSSQDFCLNFAKFRPKYG